MTERQPSDFWNYPDWPGGDNQPFWMLPPLAKVEDPDVMPAFRIFHILPGESIPDGAIGEWDRGRIGSPVL